MLRTVFTFSLNEKILERRVAIGKFDGLNPCLIAATTGDKVLIHDPSSSLLENKAASSSQKTFLNINQTVKSLTVGTLNKAQLSQQHQNTFQGAEDVLVIGTPTSILVYDVLKNSDIFYREISDGANVVVIGEVGQIDGPLVMVGGNGSLQGFNQAGDDLFWTVTGDNVTSLAICDINDDGMNELLVGSEDYDIRIFREESILHEISETDVVTCLCALLPETFAYSLNNGTVGVYHKNERLWRIKSKNQAISIIAFDINNDGTSEVVTGWSSGKIDGRSTISGDVIFKDNFSDSIAAVLKADYNKDGKDELIVCTTSGEVRGYVPLAQDASSPYFNSNLDQYSLEGKNGQDMIRDLMKRKQQLLLELKNYEESRKVSSMSMPGSVLGKASKEDDTFGAIPSDTQLKSSLEISLDPNRDASGNFVHSYSTSSSSITNTEHNLPCLQLNLWTSNDTIVRSLVIFAEGIFQGESFVVHPTDGEIDSSVRINLYPDKDIAIDLHVKALVGYESSIHYHVFELTRRLPKFSMFHLVSFQATVSENETANSINAMSKRKNSHVSFQFHESIDSLAEWLNKNFLLTEEVSIPASDSVTGLVAKFRCLRDNSDLVIELHSTLLVITTENMELAGSIIQSLMVDHCLVEEMTSSASFHPEMELLQSLILKVDEIQTVREQLAADIADSSATVRALVIRAEDSRLIREFEQMRTFYNELNSLNRELINGYKIRTRNHTDLVVTLKKINTIIQKAGNLRVGNPKSRLISSARNAVKQNNLSALGKILSS